MEKDRVLYSIAWDNVGIYRRDGPFSCDFGIVKLHPAKGTQWICYKNEKFFDSNGCFTPQKLSKFL